MLSGTWNFPTRIRFGAGRIGELGEACAELAIARPLIVTDPTLASMAMIADGLTVLRDAGRPGAVFSALHSNPVTADVQAGLAAFRDGGHDGVIAWGGGAALDVGKMVGLLAYEARGVWDFQIINSEWNALGVARCAPIIAVPTTAGTGSEVGRAAALTDEVTREKKIIFQPLMTPGRVILDPALTVSLPPKLTAATGMDALAHCLEAFCAPDYHPMADGIAIEGAYLVRRWLPEAVKDGTDLEARGHMLTAATMGAVAFQKGLGAIHSLSHPVGGIYDTHHGLTNAVFMPYVLAFNRPAIEERITALARCLDLKRAGFAGMMDWVLELRAELGIPHSARALGIEEGRLDEIARRAAADPSTPSNPRPAGVADMRAMLDAAMAGRID